MEIFVYRKGKRQTKSDIEKSYILNNNGLRQAQPDTSLINPTSKNQTS